MQPKKHLSYTGYDLTKRFEGCRLEAYLDTGGVLTIGYGHTRKVYPGQVITQDEADRLLMCDVQDAVDAVNDHVTVPLTQGQFDALVDFTFNCGTEAFKKSTMLGKLNAGDYTGAHDQFDRWVYDNGMRLAGLQKRRDAEQEAFNG